jgi:hypothetical protein
MHTTQLPDLTQEQWKELMVPFIELAARCTEWAKYEESTASRLWTKAEMDQWAAQDAIKKLMELTQLHAYGKHLFLNNQVFGDKSCGECRVDA